MQPQEAILPHIGVACDYLHGVQPMAIHVVNFVFSTYEQRQHRRCLQEILHFVEQQPSRNVFAKCRALHEVVKVSLDDLSSIQAPSPTSITEVWHRQSPDLLQGSPVIPHLSAPQAPPPLQLHSPEFIEFTHPSSPSPKKKRSLTPSQQQELKRPIPEKSDLFLHIREQLLSHVASVPNDSEALSYLGELHRVGSDHVACDPELAHTYFSQAYKINSASKMALIGLGELYRAGNQKIAPDLHKAQYYFTKVLKIEPNNDFALASLGSLLLTLPATPERAQESRQFLERAISINPENNFAKAQLYQLLLKTDASQAPPLLQTIQTTFESRAEALLKDFAGSENAKDLAKNHLKEIYLHGRVTEKHLRKHTSSSGTAFQYTLEALLQMKLIMREGFSDASFCTLPRHFLQDVIHYYNTLVIKAPTQDHASADRQVQTEMYR